MAEEESDALDVVEEGEGGSGVGTGGECCTEEEGEQTAVVCDKTKDNSSTKRKKDLMTKMKILA